MAEFLVGDVPHRSKPLCAADQWALLTRLRPILPALKGMDEGLRLGAADVGDFAKMLAPLLAAPDDDVRAVFRTCLLACERYEDGVWRPVAKIPGLVDLMRVATAVTAENFGPLFAMRRAAFKPTPSTLPKYEAVSMPNGEDWLFRPVLRGLCKLESLYDGTLRIEHLAKANDALDVEVENQARAYKAAEKK